MELHQPFFFAMHLLCHPQRNTQINRLCYPCLTKSSCIGTGGIAKSSTGRPQTAADCEQSLLRVSFKPTYARTRTHSDKGYCDLALTAGGEVINGSAYSGVVCAGMQRGKSWLSLSRTDRSYLYPPHRSPSHLSQNEGRLRDGRGRWKREMHGKTPQLVKWQVY